MLKSGLDFGIFTALTSNSEFFVYGEYIQQFLIAIAGAIGIAFANYILLPFIKYLFKKIKSKIKGNDKIPDDLEDVLLDGLDKTEGKVTEVIEKTSKEKDGK